MRRAEALATLAAMALLTWLALAAPPVVGAVVLAWALLPAPRRKALFLLAATTVAIDAALLGLVARDPLAGALAGVRLSAALCANVAVLARVGPAALVDGLRLPPRLTAWAPAVLLAAHDVARDFERLKDARMLDGDWPKGRLARVREAARLLPALFVAAERRAQARRDALRLAGHATPARFVPIVAVAALAAAGRMAFLALPNVALTYAVVFLGGLLFGPLVGALGGALAMLVTDFMLSGLYPLGLVNVPAMALLGLAGGAMRRFDWDDMAGLVFAFVAGVLATAAFSVAADTVTWLLVAPGVPAAWIALVLAGLAFNVLPAFANGLLFALSVRPVVRAFRALRSGGPAPGPAPAPGPRGAPTPAPAAGEAPSS